MDEIIVDDVDVSECSCFEEVYEEQMPYGDVLTINNYCINTVEECEVCNCFYKHNKRLKT